MTAAATGVRVSTSAPVARAVSHLSVRELIQELARLEDTVRALPARPPRSDGVRRRSADPLLRREQLILSELEARRDARSAAAGHRDLERPELVTAPPWC